MRPLRVYLDSSDYSTLSDPHRSSPENFAILEDLFRLKHEGIAEFYCSGVLLSEMAPTDATWADAASRRADLLVSLCGKNTLLSQDRIFEMELRRVTGESKPTESVYSTEGDWYPLGVADVSPVTALDMSKYINEIIAEQGMNRRARRAVNRKVLKRGRPKAAVRNAMVANARSGDLLDILTKYPMRPEDARILSRFVAGDATRQQAAEAFENSLRDPRWMMLWFKQHHAQLTPFIEWTRSPAKPFVASLQAMADHVALLRSYDAEHGTDLANDLLSAKRWAEHQERLLLNVSERLCNEFSIQLPRPLSCELLDAKCPGLSVAVRSLHSAAQTATQKNPRTPKLSDFPDAMHAVYAPYVDVFRADSFMAHFISKLASTHGTTTVPKLTNLPKVIMQRFQMTQGA